MQAGLNEQARTRTETELIHSCLRSISTSFATIPETPPTKAQPAATTSKTPAAGTEQIVTPFDVQGGVDADGKATGMSVPPSVCNTGTDDK